MIFFGGTRKPMVREIRDALGAHYLKEKVDGDDPDLNRRENFAIPFSLKEPDQVYYRGKTYSFLDYLDLILEDEDQFSNLKETLRNLRSEEYNDIIDGWGDLTRWIDLAYPVREDLLVLFLETARPTQLLSANNTFARLSILTQILGSTNQQRRLGNGSKFERDNSWKELFNKVGNDGIQAHRDALRKLLNRLLNELLPDYREPQFDWVKFENLDELRDVFMARVWSDSRNKTQAKKLLFNYARDAGRFLGRTWATGGSPKKGAVLDQNTGFINGVTVFHDFDGGIVCQPWNRV